MPVSPFHNRLFCDAASRSRERPCIAAALFLLISVAGCSFFHRGPNREYTTISADSADTQRARELNKKGASAWRQGKIEKAERFYRDALIADVNFGPAHNNLGHLYLAQQQLYLAAWEFELAANTMPGRVEPQINLGLVYEYAQRFDVAEEYYRQALAMNPRSADAISHLVRLLVRTEADKAEINHLLHELLLYDSRDAWRKWAGELLATRYRDADCCVVEVISDIPSESTGLFPKPSPGASSSTFEPIPVPIPMDGAPPLLPAPVDGGTADSTAPQVIVGPGATSSENSSSLKLGEDSTRQP